MTLKYFLLSLVGVALLLGSDSLRAAETGYYRFEPNAVLADSSGNGRNLTDTSGVFGSGQVALPGDFLNPVPPITGGASNQAAILSPTTGTLTAADQADWSNNTMTIEAMFLPTNTGGATNTLVSHWDSTTDDRSWLMAVDYGRLAFQYGALGTGDVVIERAFSGITPGKSYYAAVAFTLGDGVAADGRNITGTMYLQNLTDGGPLMFQHFRTAPEFTELFDSAAPLAIGSVANDAGRFAGTLDEVRLSDTELSEQGLLAYHPGITLEGSSGVFLETVNNGVIEAIEILDQGTSVRYAPRDFVGATLVDIVGYNQGGENRVELLMPPGSTTGDIPVGADRNNILGDLSAATGFITGTSNTPAMEFTVEFGEDLTNRPGVDVVLVDYGSPDRVDIEINSVVMDNVTPTMIDASTAGIGDGTRFKSNSGTGIDSLSDFQSVSFSANGTTSSGFTTYGIDFSDFGIAEGAVFLAGTDIVFSDALGLDAVGVFGLKEPSLGLPGDFNGDGTVDAADYAVWRNHLGDEDEAALGGNGNGQDGVDAADYDLWRTNYGMSESEPAGATTAPEPHAVCLICLAGLLGVRSTRRKNG